MRSRFHAVEVIRTKRDGRTLSPDQIKWFIDAYTRGEIADEQASALLMAIVWRGMSNAELSEWTSAMLASGKRLDLSAIAAPTVDKHSTGGVGDKVSLVLAPLIAACGGADPMLSGRGLGHTGGTLDKLESIPGFRTELTSDEIVDILKRVGCVICAATPEVAPADRKLYALRDVTGTVESIPLIASSIMSKKIAEGTQALVLDVKVGSGALMQNIADSRQLAEMMVEIGDGHGVKTRALLTQMEIPLGRAAGNAVEVRESIDALKGKGPADLVEITLALAREMADLAGLDEDPEAALADGGALERFEAMVSAQGGQLGGGLPEASEREVLRAERSGYLQKLDARAVGEAAWRLGAGRARKEDPVAEASGVLCLKKPGDEVDEGEPLVELHSDDANRFPAALAELDEGVVVGPEPPDPLPLVIERIA